MTKEKQIKEIQKEIIRWGENADRTGNYGYALSEHLVDQGYRKIYDDNQRQCVCYALGCQMAEELERKVAREIFNDLNEMWHKGRGFINYSDLVRLERLHEQKYTEEK